MPMATLPHPVSKGNLRIFLEKFIQQCQDNILYVYHDVGVGRVGIGIFYE
jgi:hypothetical protein